MNSPDGFIRVHGARLHNLQNVDVEVPRDCLVAFTGISGSGKSSLAFGTIHGEAQRRYFDSVAPFARRLIHTALDPQVRDITGLPPAVAVQQQRGGASSRSSVGTITTTGSSLRMLFSRCGDYPAGIPRMDSDHFSVNTALGACPSCSGLGKVYAPTEASMVPDPDLSIADGAIAAWPRAWQGKNYRDIVATLGFDINAPWGTLPQADRDFILFSDDEPVVTVTPVRELGRIQGTYQGRFSSAKRYVLHTLSDSRSASYRTRALRHVETSPCPLCHGRRLRPEALAVSWQGLAIDEAAAMSVQGLMPLLTDRLDEFGDSGGTAIDEAERMILRDLTGRLQVLIDLGIGHLDLGRPSASVSAGELQRLRVATAVRSGLFGVVYVLDEPSAGLHPRDTEALLRALRGLVAAGNSVLVVEHDMSVVQACDWVVDVGPGAGTNGGEVLHSGSVTELAGVTGSITAEYLDRPVHVAEVREHPSPRERTGEISLTRLTRHTLRDVDVVLPLGVFTVLTGISGAGKSSLLDAMHDAVGDRLAEVASPDEEADDTERGTGEAVVQARGRRIPTRMVRITQRPIGRTPRSNLATYTGLFDHVRKLFARTELARERGYGVGRFSFNVPAGRCPTCQGEGSVAVELLFLPGTYSTCPDCHGQRYNAETLEVTWQGRTVADVLGLTVAEALPVFAEEEPVRRALQALFDLGLDYLRLGQPATELSGGEAQRIKLATELQQRRRTATLYLLDEPTTGLHPADVHRLLRQLHGLVDAGHTVVLAEHDPVALATADWIIELGPGAGAAGGQIVSAAVPARSALLN